VPEWVVRGLKPLAAGGLTVYGIPAYTALVVDQHNLPQVSEPARGSFEVVGRGPVTVWGKDGRQRIFKD